MIKCSETCLELFLGIPDILPGASRKGWCRSDDLVRGMVGLHGVEWLFFLLNWFSVGGRRGVF